MAKKRNLVENMRKELEEIANEILNNSNLKPNYSNRDFMKCAVKPIHHEVWMGDKRHANAFKVKQI